MLNFLQCHLSVIALLDKAKALGCLEHVSDEGEFWEKRDLQALSMQVGLSDQMIAAFGGLLKELSGDGSLGVELAVGKYPDFERLEATGQNKLPSGLRNSPDSSFASRERSIRKKERIQAYE